MSNAEPNWHQTFRRMVITNINYWLEGSEEDPQALEVAPVLYGVETAMPVTEIWDRVRTLMLRVDTAAGRHTAISKWGELLAKAINRCRELGDPAELPFRLSAGRIYRLQGQLPKAWQTLQRAQFLCQEQGRDDLAWRVMVQLAHVARQRGLRKQALEYGRQILDAYPASQPARAEALNVFGLVALDQRELERALAYFEQSLALYRSLDDPYEQARLLTNRGLTLTYMNCLDEAEASYRHALPLFKQGGDEVERFKAIQNLGFVFMSRKNFQAAIEQFKEALPAFEAFQYTIDLARTHNNLGWSYAGLEDWPTAEAHYLKAIDRWGQLDGYAYDLANTYDNLGILYGQTGRLQEALAAWRQSLDALERDPDNPACIALRREIMERMEQLGKEL